jgi:pimeloyl-ACP methyl ester carboxylesterase
MEKWSTVDVSSEAAVLDVPTLVVHCRGDVRVPFEQGRLIASLIQGSRLVPLESRSHLFHPDEPAWQQVFDEIDAFLSQD